MVTTDGHDLCTPFGLVWYANCIRQFLLCCYVQHLNVLLILYMEAPFMHRNGCCTLVYYASYVHASPFIMLISVRLTTMQALPWSHIF